MAVFAHELSHNLGLPDNYNNPFAAQQQRTAGGMWDMMSRGSFNGPGGQHTRWMIPPTQGAALGAQHGIRNKQKLNFVATDDVLTLNRNGLATSGTVVAEVKAREVSPGDDLAGVRVLLDGAGRHRTRPAATTPTRCARARGTRRPPAGHRGFNDYTVEVVQQIGSDSFTGRQRRAARQEQERPTRPAARSTARPGTSTPTRRTSTRSTTSRRTARPKATLGDERQLNDGTFHAGTNSGSTYEYTATPNDLHFYILDKRTDAQGVAHYNVGVRSLAGAGPQTRGVAARLRPTRGTAEGLRPARSPLKNTGAAATCRPAAPRRCRVVLRQRHLPPVGVRLGQRLDGVPEERVRHREVR